MTRSCGGLAGYADGISDNPLLFSYFRAAVGAPTVALLETSLLLLDYSKIR